MAGRFAWEGAVTSSSSTSRLTVSFSIRSRNGTGGDDSRLMTCVSASGVEGRVSSIEWSAFGAFTSGMDSTDVSTRMADRSAGMGVGMSLIMDEMEGTFRSYSSDGTGPVARTFGADSAT